MAIKRLSASVADYILNAGPLDGENSIVVRFRAREAISEMFRVVVDVASTDPDVVFEDVVGEDATLTVIGAEEHQRFFNGIVSRFELIGQGEEHIEYRLEIVPKLWLLTMQTRCRIFQGKKVPTILKEVLTGGGLADDEFVLPAENLFDPRDYCVQYNESDFAFVSRLMEEEGLLYFFTHTDSGHVMEIGPPTIHEDIEGEAELEFKDIFGGAVDEEFVYRFTMSQEVRPGKVTLRDWDFEKPSHTTEESKEGEADQNLEIYSFPGEYVQNPDVGAADNVKDYTGRGGGWAEARIEELNTRRIRGRGRSSCRRFVAGMQWDLTKHPRDELNQKYTLVSVEHEGNQKDALGQGSGSGEGDVLYENVFEVIPETTKFRPPRLTPKPKILGTQTAVVTGPGSEEIHTDKFGRVKVKFPWDQSDTTEDKTSCWLRVSHNLAGQGWGSIFIPRIGMEVLVTHLDADPDRPLVTGCVYNAEHGVPYPLPAQKTKSTVKSNSSKGGGGFNEFRLEDAKGSEEIFAHAQKDYNIVVENDRTKNVGHDEKFEIGNNQTGEVKVDQKLTVGSNRTHLIGVDQTETIGANHTITIGANLTETVGAAYAETVGAAMTLSVGGALAVTVGAAASVSVGGNASTAVGGDQGVSVGGDASEAVAGNRSRAVDGDESVAIKGAHAVAVDGDRAIAVSGTGSEEYGGDYALKAPKVLVDADEITLKAGSSKIVMKSDGITIKGSKITVKGSGNVIVKGSTIAEN